MVGLRFLVPSIGVRVPDPQQMKNKKLVWGSTIFGVIVLGIVTNAIWDLLKPISKYMFQFLLNLSILGKEKFKNGIYEEIAKGFHEGSAFEVFRLTHSIFLGIILMTVVISFILRNKILSYENEENKNSFFEKINNFHGKVIKKSVYAWFLFLYLIFAGTIVTLDLVREKYINNSITHFQQLIIIVEPYISKEEVLLYKSKFAQIKNKNDYVDLINNLENTLNQNKQRVPEFNFVF